MTEPVSVGTITGIVGMITGVTSLVITLLTYRRGSTRIRLRVTADFPSSQNPAPTDHIEIVNQSQHAIVIRQIGYVRSSGELDPWTARENDDPLTITVDARTTKKLPEPVMNGVFEAQLRQWHPEIAARRGCYLVDGTGSLHTSPGRWTIWTWKVRTYIKRKVMPSRTSC
jgi:hypothetical protein